LAVLVVGILCLTAAELPARAEAARQQGQFARDWAKYPTVVEVDTPHDVFALGDVHGDYDRLVTLLTTTKILADEPSRPEKARWAAGKAVLVCTGDMIDKGNQALRVIALLRALQESARAAGGRVLVTMGNHEATFLASPTKGKKTEEFRKELLAQGLDPSTVGAGRDTAGVGQFLGNLPFAARVNDWFFAHAGNTHGRTLKQLAADLQAGVERDGFQSAVLQSADSLLEARLHPQPWWEKSGENAAAGKQRLARYVAALGVKHLVIGHQPGNVTFADGTVRKKGQIHQAHDGLIFLIDVGMSRAVGYSTGALLHIQTSKEGRATALFPYDRPHRLWP
jgi:hypothetical protein